MKIDQLIYFAEAAREQHLGRAAKLLGISASAVSHSIKSLEGELGLQLFVQQGRQLVLTGEGRRLLERSEELIAAFQNLKYDLVPEKDDRHYFKMGASHGLSQYFAAPTWAALSQEYSKTKIELLSLRSADVLQGVLHKNLDLGLLFSPQEHPDLHSTTLHTGQILVAVGSHHPVLKTRKKSQRLQELSDYPAVLPKAFQGIEICQQSPMFAKFGLDPQPVTLTDSYDVSFQLLQHGNSWAFVPDVLLRCPAAQNIKAIQPRQGWDAPYTVSLVWRKSNFLPQFFHDFSKALETRLV